MDNANLDVAETEYLAENSINFDLNSNYDHNIGEILPLDPPECPNQNFPYPKKERYKRKRVSKPFIEFVFEKSGKLLKKDNYRTKIIRGHKKAIRSALNKKISYKSTNRPNNPNLNVYWEIFKNHAIENPNHLKIISMTMYGPKSDGDKKKSEEQKLMAHKSYNGKYCSDYFSCDVTRTSFLLYCDYAFMFKSCEDFIKRFNYFCCNNQKHDESCQVRWKMLEEYTRKTMIEELKFYR